MVTLASAAVYSAAEGSSRYEKVTINLMGKTDPVKYSISGNTFTVKFRNEGSDSWIYTQKIYARSRVVKEGTVYTFSLSAGIRSMEGKDIIARASADLDGGGELYEEWKIDVSGKIKMIHSSVKLYKLLGVKNEKEKLTDIKPAEKKKIKLSIFGRTPHISEELIGNNFIVRIKERNSNSWIYRKGITPAVSRDTSGNTYTIVLNSELELVTGKPVRIEAFATLEDGREIFGNFDSNLSFPGDTLNISLDINSYRGAKISGEPVYILDPDEVILDGSIDLPAKIIRNLDKLNDKLLKNFDATLIIRDTEGNQLISIMIPMKPFRYGSYRGNLSGAIQLRSGIDKVKLDIFILTTGGKKVYSENNNINITNLRNRKTLKVQVNLESIR